mgnify:CR=1 FL=1
MKRNSLIICRGGGDLATGIVHRLHRAGFRVLVLERIIRRRSAVRFRSVRRSTKEKRPWKA